MKDEIKGKAEEVHGKMTGDKSEELKGKAYQAVDKVRRAGRDIRDDVHQRRTSTATRPSASARPKRSRSAAPTERQGRARIIASTTDPDLMP